MQDCAGRLEICGDLPRGGTPNSVAEPEAMLWDIADAKRTGLAGVVIGASTRSASARRRT